MNKVVISALLAIACVILPAISFAGVPFASAASVTVTTLDDSGPGSLRAAIDLANTNPGPDTITFSFSGSINLLSSLTLADSGTTIDGSGQNVTVIKATPGNVFNGITSSATFKGFAIHSAPGFAAISAGNADCTDPVSGLTVTSMSIVNGKGIWICSPQVGGIVITHNTITSQSSNAIYIPEVAGGAIDGITISENATLTSLDLGAVSLGGSLTTAIRNVSIANNGTIRGCGVGPAIGIISASNSNIAVSNNTSITGGGGAIVVGGGQVGGTTNNGISISNNGSITAQVHDGVNIEGANNSNITINGNGSITGPTGAITIGKGGSCSNVTINGNASLLGQNGTGVSIGNGQAPNDHITINDNGRIEGGATRSAISISGNPNSGVSINNNSITGAQSGIRITGKQGTGNSISGNTIYQNDTGIAVGDSNFTISANTIRDNTGSGVVVLNGIGNRITQNSIYANAKLGIDLGGDGVTPNDPGDTDKGPNNLQNYPMLTAAASFGGSTAIAGTLNSTPNATFRLEFFSSPSRGQGKTFLGAANMATAASGNASFVVTLAATVPTGETITATATDPGNNTSEFSQPIVPPVSTTGCQVTYGGNLTTSNGDKATVGGNAQVAVKGEQQYTDHGPAVPMDVHSINVLAVICGADGKQASILGQATINGAGSYTYQIDLKDLGEPGTSDTYRMRMSNGYDSGEHILEGGNVQVH